GPAEHEVGAGPGDVDLGVEGEGLPVVPHADRSAAGGDVGPVDAAHGLDEGVAEASFEGRLGDGGRLDLALLDGPLHRSGLCVLAAEQDVQRLDRGGAAHVLVGGGADVRQQAAVAGGESFVLAGAGLQGAEPGDQHVPGRRRGGELEEVPGAADDV